MTKQCSKYKKNWRQNMPLKQKVMFISQTSLQTSETCACMTGCATMVRHIRSVKTFLVHIQIGYIHCIYIRARTLHDCSLALAALGAAALARSLVGHSQCQTPWSVIVKQHLVYCCITQTQVTDSGNTKWQHQPNTHVCCFGNLR